MGLKRYMVDHRASPHLALHVLVIFKSKTAPHPVICPCKLVMFSRCQRQRTNILYNDICLKLEKGSLYSYHLSQEPNPGCH